MADSTSSSSYSITNNKKSVFDTGYLDVSTAVHGRTYTTKAYIQGTNSFWEFVLMNFSETHEETYALHNTLSESMIIHATGAKPVEITMQGMFTSGKNLDSRMKFIAMYSGEFRPSVLQRKNSEVTVHVRDTSFKLLITSVNVEEDVSMEEFTQVSISGIAYGYHTTNIITSYSQGNYYGKNAKSYSSSKTEETVNALTTSSDTITMGDISSKNAEQFTENVLNATDPEVLFGTN